MRAAARPSDWAAPRIFYLLWCDFRRQPMIGRLGTVGPRVRGKVCIFPLSRGDQGPLWAPCESLLMSGLENRSDLFIFGLARKEPRPQGVAGAAAELLRVGGSQFVNCFPSGWLHQKHCSQGAGRNPSAFPEGVFVGNKGDRKNLQLRLLNFLKLYLI